MWIQVIFFVFCSKNFGPKRIYKTCDVLRTFESASCEQIWALKNSTSAEIPSADIMNLGPMLQKPQEKCHQKIGKSKSRYIVLEFLYRLDCYKMG
jgi:hypothetical protein